MAKFAIKVLEFEKVKEKLAKKAATSLGKVAALNLKIETNYGKVKELLSETDEALRILNEAEKFPLGGAKNITGVLKYAKIGSVLEIESLVDVLDTLITMRRMKKFLNERVELAPNLLKYANSLREFQNIEKQIDNSISDKGEIKDSASTKLGGLRTGILIAQERVKTKLNSILHSEEYKKYFQEQLVTIRGDRYVIPIKQEYKFNFPGVVHDQSSSGATLFIEPLAIVNLNNDIKTYKAKVKEEEERILRKLSSIVGAEANEILKSLEIFTQIDLIVAKAYLAQEYKASRPMMSLNGEVNIFQGRHPLIDQDKVVPLDINLGKDFNTLLITGPNTGGKTVAIKVVGLFALMAQCGIFLPAKVVKLPVFTGIYADIGDEQSIEQSLSTFSGHMTNIVNILNEVKSGELVLIDEICAGTDPNEGAVLAMSILDKLHRAGVNTIVTTHYSELKNFAYEHEGMENASVEFNPETLRPTYKLLMGIPGSSNAFYIANRLGLSNEIVENARNLLSKEQIHVEQVLQNLEGERREYEAQNKEIKELKLQSMYLKRSLEVQNKELSKKKNEILHKAREEANQIYRNSRLEADNVLKELRKLKKDFDTKHLAEIASKAKQKLNKSYEIENDYTDKGRTLTIDNVSVGQTVFLTKLGQKGVVLRINGKNIFVQIGAMKTNVAIKDCLLVSEAKRETSDQKPKLRKKYTQTMIKNKIENAVLEIDVRGMNVMEAIPIVEKSIDNAMLSGQGRLRIIHGKGTGMLRKGLHEYFRGSKLIKSYSFAPANEGGDGATIVSL